MILCLEQVFLKKEISWIWQLTADIVNKSGAWYAYNGDKIGQGRENAKIFLKEHTDICDEIEKQVRIHYNLLPGENAEAQSDPVGETEE